MVNPFRAHVASNKKILALIQDERFEHLVAGAEGETIRQTLPWTRILRRGRTTYGDWRFELLSFVSENPRAEVRRVEVAVAGPVQLGGQVGAQYGKRPLARNRPPRPTLRTALAVLRGYLPFVPAAPAPPPDRLHGPARPREGVEVPFRVGCSSAATSGRKTASDASCGTCLRSARLAVAPSSA